MGESDRMLIVGTLVAIAGLVLLSIAVDHLLSFDYLLLFWGAMLMAMGGRVAFNASVENT